MKIPESWLREWVDPELESAALAHQLTMLGHEVDGVDRYGDGLGDVIVATVADAIKHPNADKLTLCKVDDGNGELLDVVCGAPNVVVGMKAALARPGVRLPNGMKLRKAKIRGVESNGMLCSAAELGLGDEADGILHLPADATVGTALPELLQLPDAVIDLDLTPNRGDCFSVLGIARDVAALTGAELRDPAVAAADVTTDVTHPVERVLPEGCPRFAGRVVSGIDTGAETPLWMAERLRRAGLRSISPVVDVTNYVMLEYGQPLHAYDAGKLRGPIRPRAAAGGETLRLLDERDIECHADTLLITDDSGPIGLAGIMGGASTAVSASTRDVYFEAAYWPPAYMAGQARSYGLHTDASLRFERGVDPEGQARAIERATALLLEIAGGAAGPLDDQVSPELLPSRDAVDLRHARLSGLLGVELPAATVTEVLQRLHFGVATTSAGWRITPPSYRFDIAIETDLIEEVARIHGYDAIPETTEPTHTPLKAVPGMQVDRERVVGVLLGRDFQEVITWSFIDADVDAAFAGEDSGLVLSNPISSEMAVMRRSLWPGMLAAAASNSARQQDRVRLFEFGRTYHGDGKSQREVDRIGELICGPVQPEQWAAAARAADFFDIKGDVEALLALAGPTAEFGFESVVHPALQPGQAASVLREGQAVGLLGRLHPAMAKRFDLKRPVYLFELDAKAALATVIPRSESVSRYPAVRRDIAVIVDASVPAAALSAAVAAAEPSLVRDVRIFDIYTGEGIEAGRKSVAIGLILQETSRTLTDDDADRVLASAITILKDQFAAVLRD